MLNPLFFCEYNYKKIYNQYLIAGNTIKLAMAIPKTHPNNPAPHCDLRNFFKYQHLLSL